MVKSGICSQADPCATRGRGASIGRLHAGADAGLRLGDAASRPPLATGPATLMLEKPRDQAKSRLPQTLSSWGTTQAGVSKRCRAPSTAWMPARNEGWVSEVESVRAPPYESGLEHPGASLGCSPVRIEGSLLQATRTPWRVSGLEIPARARERPAACRVRRVRRTERSRGNVIAACNCAATRPTHPTAVQLRLARRDEAWHRRWPAACRPSCKLAQALSFLWSLPSSSRSLGRPPPDDRKRLAIKACFSASQLSKRLRPDRKRGAAPQAQRSLAALYDAKLLLNPGFAQ